MALHRLESAARQWVQTAREVSQSPRASQKELCDCWLEEKALPAIRDVLERKEIRTRVRSSIEQLAPGSSSAARRIIDQLDKTIRDAASALTAVIESINQSAARRKSQKRIGKGHKRSAISTLSGKMSDAKKDDRTTSAALPTRQPPTLGALTDRLAFIQARPWRDLVSEFDFFGPAVGLNLENKEAWFGPGARKTQVADFLPYFHPRLQRPGDFIERCFLIRVAYWRRTLLETWRQISCLPNAAKCDFRLPRKLLARLEALTRQFEALRDRDPETSVCRAAMALLQIYAARRPNADFTWLGSASRMAVLATLLTLDSSRREPAVIPEHVAEAFCELARFFDQGRDPETVIKRMVALHQLCIVAGRGRRELYWKGELVDIDWQRRNRAWTLFTALCEDAHKTAQGVDDMSDLGVSLRDASADLRKLLPAALANSVIRKSHVYRLTIARQDIWRGDFQSEDFLEDT